MIEAARRRDHGFTLLEVMAVIVVIALATALIANTIGGGLGQARVRAAAKDLVAALRYTRSQAVVKGQAQALTLDVEKRAYQAPGRGWVELPDGMQLTMLTAAQERVDEGVGRIRFFPDGASTGGNVRLIRGEAEWQINVAWLTGEVSLAAGSPQ